MKLQIQEWLDKSGVTQADLARILKVPPVYIYRWTKGHNLPSLEHFYKISKIFKIKMEQLIKEK